MQIFREGTGRPLLLVHGLGSNARFWKAISSALAKERELITVDLPGHGATPADADSGTFAGLARSLAEFLAAEGLSGVDIAGSSLGARLALEMARQGRAGSVVALDPGGFWQGWERAYLRNTLLASVYFLRGVRPALPTLAHLMPARTMLLFQLSAQPWALDPDMVEAELASYASTPTFDALVKDLAAGSMQGGPAAAETERVTIGWGRRDRLCLPAQAERAMAAFPSARLHWFDNSGHFPVWDQPEDAAALILASTG